MTNTLYKINFYIQTILGKTLATKDFEIEDNLLFNASEDLSKIENDEVRRYCDLYDIVTKDDFVAKSKEKNFKDSLEYKQKQEFDELIKNKYVKYFVKSQKSQLFKFYENYEQTFYDNFKDSDLDKTKWNTFHYWGGKLLKDNYSLKHERHINNDANIQTGSGLMLTVKKEDIEGKVWDGTKGFVLQKRHYSAATLNTAEKFSAKYGIVKVKAKLSSVKGLQNIICLQNIKNDKLISVVNSNKKGKVSFGVYDRVEKKLKAHISKLSFDPSKDFFIYSVEWTPESVIWKINGTIIRKITENIPSEQMYLSVNTSIRKNVEDSEFPKHLEIEWIKCFQLKQ